jgi:predicted protein tyrosine phosphatase
MNPQSSGCREGHFAPVGSPLMSNAKSNLKRLLFVCSRNKLRSPTAEQVFSTWKGIEVASAGLAADAETPLTADLVEWADIIFVMEKAHRSKLSAQFKGSLNGQRIVCLNVPDRYAFMEPALVSLLTKRVPKFLGVGSTLDRAS